MTPFLSKIKSVSKTKKGLLLLAGLMAIATYVIVDPLKVTDPADPKFNPDNFSFNDYIGTDNTIEAFRKLFPVGTPKEFVDRVLVRSGKATTLQSKDYPEEWVYATPSFPFIPGGQSHIFIFSETNTVDNIMVTGSFYVYPDRITMEKLRGGIKGVESKGSE